MNMTDTDKQAGKAATSEELVAREINIKEPLGFFANRWRLIKKTFSFTKSEPMPEAKNYMDLYEIEEIKALYRFVVDKGIKVKSELIRDLARLIILVDKRQKVNPKESESEDVENLLQCYSELTTITYSTFGVSGRTIRDSARFSEDAISQAGAWGVAFFILALIPDAVYLSLDEDSQLLGITSFFVSLSPFFWGGVGSSIFLLKSLSEIAGRSKFDSRKLQGIPTRILLGAFLGYIIVVVLQITDILESSDFSEEVIAFQFSSSAVAFLTGIGTKAVYGILEMIIEGISSRLGVKKK